MLDMVLLCGSGSPCAIQLAQGDLIVGGGAGEGLTAYEITTPGAPITSVSPSGIGRSTTDTVYLSGSGFGGSPRVIVSGDGVVATAVSVVSPTTLKVTLTVSYSASQSARDITVIEPASPDVADTCTACLAIGPKPAKPTITSVAPSSFVHGWSSGAADVLGTNFDPGAVVTSHSGINITTKYVGATQLNVSINVKATLAPGAYNLFVTDSDGLVAKCAGCLTVT